MVVAAGVGVVLFVLSLVAQVVFHTSIDPTERGFHVTLQNDTAGTVVVKQCNAECDSFREQDRLGPGGRVVVNTSTDDVASWWAVTDSTGRTVGCLSLRYTHEIEGLVVRISRHTSCPAGTAGSGGGGVAAAG